MLAMQHENRTPHLMGIMLASDLLRFHRGHKHRAITEALKWMNFNYNLLYTSAIFKPKPIYTYTKERLFIAIML